jgi:hypothetical protein
MNLLMLVQQLLDRLRETSPLRPASCFVLLFTWFERRGLGIAQNALEAEGLRDFRKLAPLPGGFHPKRNLQQLTTTRDRGDAFDVLALRWLKSLDRNLMDEAPEDLDEELQGFDRAPYRLCRWNHFIADHYSERGQGVTWAADQDRAIETFAPHHTAVPVGTVEGCKLDIRGDQDWGNEALHHRLWEARRQFKVMHWPFACSIRYPTLEQPPPSAENAPEPVHLDRIENEEEVRNEVLQALREARRQKATVLIFPELVFTPVLENEVAGWLEQEGLRNGYPILTLISRSHRPVGDGRSHNEAVLFTAGGEVLHIHRKLVRYTHRKLFKESLEVGDTVSVLECALGNVVPLICLDFLNTKAVRRRLEKSHATIFLVPSLSNKTSAHEHAAQHFQVRQLASTFVCNRRLKDQPTAARPEGTSFFQVPRRDEARTKHHGNDRPEKPYLCFDLE